MRLYKNHIGRSHVCEHGGIGCMDYLTWSVFGQSHIIAGFSFDDLYHDYTEIWTVRGAFGDLMVDTISMNGYHSDNVYGPVLNKLHALGILETL